MATNVGSIFYKLGLDTKEFDKKAKSLGGKMDNIGKSMQDTGKKMSLFVTLPVVAGMTAMVKSASDFNETINKTEVAFGDQADAVKKWGETTLENIGMAKTTSLEMASNFGDMATSMGLNNKEAMQMSTSLVDLAGDLASFKNISADRAQIALNAVFTGETETLKRLGVVMTQANLEQYAMSQGIEKNIADMTQAEKVQLRYGFVMEKTKNAQGDFARTFDGTANQIRVNQERMKELSQELGEQLLPLANKLLEVVGGWLKSFKDLSPETKKTILIIAGVVAGIGPLLYIGGKLIMIIKGIALAFTFLSANPIILVLMGIALVAFLIIKNWDKLWNFIKAFTAGVIEKLKQFVSWYLNIYVTIWNKLTEFVTKMFRIGKDILLALWNGIKAIYGGYIDWWVKLPSRIVRAIGNVARLLFDKGKQMIRGLWDGMKSMYNKIPSWARKILEGAFNVSMAPLRGAVSLFKKITPFADGGTFRAGQPMLVGERGPELIMPKRSGEVIPNDKLSGNGLNVFGGIHVNERASLQTVTRALGYNQEVALGGTGTKK